MCNNFLFSSQLKYCSLDVRLFCLVVFSQQILPSQWSLANRFYLLSGLQPTDSTFLVVFSQQILLSQLIVSDLRAHVPTLLLYCSCLYCHSFFIFYLFELKRICKVSIYRLFISVLPSDIQSSRRVWIQLTGLTPPHSCACHKPQLEL